jgi:hypothetical protein
MKWNEQQEWDGGEGVTVEVKVQVSFKILGSVLESSCKDAGDGRGHREGVTGTRLEGRTRRKATMLRRCASALHCWPADSPEWAPLRAPLPYTVSSLALLGAHRS